MRAAHADTGQRVKSPEWQYNTYVCPSVRSSAVILQFLYICINFQCGGPASRCIYPHTGVQKTHVGSSRAYTSVCISVYSSVSLSICPVDHVTFWRSKCAACNYVQRMRPQATESNTPSGSIICPSVHPSVCPSVRLSGRLQAFCNFLICINFQCGGPTSQCIYPHTGE